MRLARIALGALCLPVAFIAVVVLRAVPLREFWSAYWMEWSND